MAGKFQLGTGQASFAVFIASALWGLFWIPIRYFNTIGLDGEWALIAMNTPAMLVLLMVFAATFAQHRQHLRPAMWIGLASGVGFAFYSAGLIHTSVIRATLFFYLTPIWSTLIGAIWLKEDIRWQRGAAIMLGMFGLLCLVSGESSVPFGIGDLLGLLSGIAWAIAAALIKHNNAVTVVSMTLMQYVVVAVVALGVGYAIAPLTPPAPDRLFAAMPMIIGISLGLVLPTTLLLFWASQFLFPGRVGLLMMSEALVAVVSASILLPEERLGAVQWIGAILIISASIAELLPSRRHTTVLK